MWYVRIKTDTRQVLNREFTKCAPAYLFFLSEIHVHSKRHIITLEKLDSLHHETTVFRLGQGQKE